MTISVRDPAGNVHTFADGTPDDVINAQMSQRWAQAQKPQAPAPAPLARPGMMPPGANPGTISAKPGSELETDMVPLSAEAQRALRMIAGGGATNNRALEQAGRMILEKDPTYQARTAQTKAIGDAAGKRQAARLAGENILSSYAKLLHSFNKADDDTLLAAIGPQNTAKLQEKNPTYIPLTQIPIPFLEKPTTVDPRTGVPIAGQITPVQRNAILKPEDTKAKAAWDLQNLFGHDVHGITNAMVASAGSGVKMSDARQEMFDSAMRDFMHSTNRKEALNILDHAKGIIQNDFNLTPEEADAVIMKNMIRFRAADVPAPAINELVANRDNPVYIKSFNKNFNEAKPGLAEYLIRAYSEPQQQ